MTSAPSIAVSAMEAIGPARSAGTPVASSCAASRAVQDAKAARAATVSSSSSASIATPATGQPPQPPEASTDWRHRSMNQASTPPAVSAGQARR
jgi:hypothetical protein